MQMNQDTLRAQTPWVCPGGWAVCVPYPSASEISEGGRTEREREAEGEREREEEAATESERGEESTLMVGSCAKADFLFPYGHLHPDVVRGMYCKNAFAQILWVCIYV